MADLDVEFVKANPKSEGEAMEVVKDADAILNRAGWEVNNSSNPQKIVSFSSVFSWIQPH